MGFLGKHKIWMNEETTTTTTKTTTTSTSTTAKTWIRRTNDPTLLLSLSPSTPYMQTYSYIGKNVLLFPFHHKPPPLVPRNAIYDLRHRACAHKLAYFIFSISVCCLFWLFYVFSLPPPPDVVVAMVVGIWNYCICCDCWLLLSLFYGIKKKSKPLKEPTAGQPTDRPDWIVP